MSPSLSAPNEIAFQRPSRLMAGVALSLLLHGAILFAWRQHAASKADERPVQRSIAVWLRPPVKVEPAPAATPAATSTPTRSAKPKRHSAPDLIAMPQRQPSESVTRPDVFTVEPPAPRFDIDAARKLAREVASEPDPAKVGTAVAQVPPKPLATETRAARAIAKAARRDCKDGIPGGLLAPLYLMMDKKDSGCKW